MRIYFTTLFLFISLLAHSQKISESWTSEQLEQANTAKNADYLTEEEKQVILYSNLVRMDGRLFSETFLNDYLKDKKQSKYSRSLYRDLKQIKGLPVLVPEKDLFLIAHGHADISGKRGTVGHQRFEKRFKPLLGKYNRVAENCAYGYDKAIDIVIRLLIDEGIPDLGHRKNLLNPEMNSIGISIQPHKKFRTNCVMDFGRTER